MSALLSINVVSAAILHGIRDHPAGVGLITSCKRQIEEGQMTDRLTGPPSLRQALELDETRIDLTWMEHNRKTM